MVDIHFEIEGPMDKPLYVIGSAVEIGGWNPTKAFPLQQEGNLWVADIRIPSDSVVSWKTLSKSDDEITWENGENRIIFQQKQISISLINK